MSQSTGHDVSNQPDWHSEQSLDVFGREAFNPAFSWTPFWKPRFARASSALGHLPYLFWLIENHRPKRIAQIGVGDGVAYLAICQAVDKLELNAACRGLSLAPDEGEAQHISDFHSQNYGDFSKLSTERLSAAHRHYPKGGIDLLIINQRLTQELAIELKEKWNARLSDRGLIVVIDSQTRMFEDGAADWLDPLIEEFPTIELDQGLGVLTIALGSDQDPRISRLASLDLGMPGYRETRQMFETLGSGLKALQSANELEAASNAQSESLAAAQEQIKTINTELSAAHESESSAHDQLANAQASIFDLRTEREALEAKFAAALSQANAAEKSGAARVEELEEKLAQAMLMAQELERCEDKLVSSEAKLKEVCSQLTETECAISNAAAKADELEREFLAEREQLADELSAKLQKLDELEARYRERLIDISELGHAIGSKDKEIDQLRALHEESELRRHILSKLSIAGADIRNALGAKRRLRRKNTAIERVDEEIRLVEASEHFDPEWYLAFYPDVAEEGGDPARHFVTHGAYELRNPGPKFDSFKYHRAFPDVTSEGMAAFVHYVRFGRAEERETFPVGER